MKSDVMRALEAALAGCKTGTGIVHTTLATEPDADVRHACYLAIVRQKYPDFDGDIHCAANCLYDMKRVNSTPEMMDFIVKAMEQESGGVFTKDGYRLHKA